MLKNTNKDKFKLFNFNAFSAFENIEHYISTREGGCSPGVYQSLNLGKNTQDNLENVKANRLALAHRLATNTANMTFPQQTHSGNVKVLDSYFFSLSDAERDIFLHETDGIVTNVKGEWINVLAADCVPVLVYDPKKEVIAAVHAGWRSCVQGILQHTIMRMVETYASQPSDLYVGIGPSISQANYEVGKEVVTSFEKAFPQFFEQIFADFKEEGKAHLNLWDANKLQAMEMGVFEENIEVLGLCTYEHYDTFFSSRYDKGITGRFATGIKLN